MRSLRHAIAMGALVALPAFAAAAPAQKPAAAKHTTTAAASTHATKGTIKSVDASTLVIARSPKSKQSTTFVLDSSTERHGDLAVGSTVEVRYRTDANKKIATVVSVQNPKKQA